MLISNILSSDFCLMHLCGAYRDICLQTLLSLFKCANFRNKRPFVSTVNEALVGTFGSGRCLLIKDIFAPVCDYAGNVDLNKCYRNPKRKLGVTTHFSKIIHE